MTADAVMSELSLFRIVLYLKFLYHFDHAEEDTLCTIVLTSLKMYEVRL